MDACLHPNGDVYQIELEPGGLIRLPAGTHGFSVIAVLRNISDVAWDTSDLLRVAVMLIEPSEKEKLIPRCLTQKRAYFKNRYVYPGESTRLDVALSVNLIPEGDYLLVFDLVVDGKYFLFSTGARRPEFPVKILGRDAANEDIYSRVSKPSGTPRRAWRLDPESHSSRHAFHLTRIGGGGPHETGKTVVRFTWGFFYFRHYAHFLEFVICLYAICREYIGDDAEIILLIGDQEFSNGNNPDVQRIFLNALFRRWVCLPVSDLPGLEGVANLINFNGNRQDTSMNRLIVDYRDVVRAWFPTLRSRCLGSISDPVTRSSARVALYAKRGANRALEKAAEVDLFLLLESFGFQVEAVDLGALTIEGQINAVRRASVMFGVHGNNLTNCIWLEKGAALIELFPAGFHSYDFQILCETAGARYLGVEGRERGFVHREGTRWPGWTLLPEPFRTLQNHQDAVSHVPLDVVSSFLEGLA